MRREECHKKRTRVHGPSNGRSGGFVDQVTDDWEDSLRCGCRTRAHCNNEGNRRAGLCGVHPREFTDVYYNDVTQWILCVPIAFESAFLSCMEHIAHVHSNIQQVSGLRDPMLCPQSLVICQRAAAAREPNVVERLLGYVMSMLRAWSLNSYFLHSVVCIQKPTTRRG